MAQTAECGRGSWEWANRADVGQHGFMQMTESFATTTAAVAPVILIAAALEVAAYQQAIQGWARNGVDFYLDLKNPTESGTREAHQEDTGDPDKTIATWVLGGMKSQLRLIFGVLWGLIMMAQAAATVGCLAWLGDPKHPADPVEAHWLLVIIGGRG